MTDVPEGGPRNGFVVPEVLRSTYITAYMPLSRPLLDSLTRRRSDEEVAAAKRAREERRATVERDHAHLLTDADGLAAEMLDLHAPVFNGGIVECGGCCFSGYEGEPPEWPCTTYERVAARYARSFEDGPWNSRMYDTRSGWYYGPTGDDPDPSKMWHNGCGQEVHGFDNGYACGCGQQWDENHEPLTNGASPR